MSRTVAIRWILSGGHRSAKRSTAAASMPLTSIIMPGRHLGSDGGITHARNERNAWSFLLYRDNEEKNKKKKNKKRKTKRKTKREATMSDNAPIYLGDNAIPSIPLIPSMRKLLRPSPDVITSPNLEF